MAVFGRMQCGVLLLSLCVSAAAENYKCKLADGSTTYQDTPCTSNAATQQVVNTASGSVLGLTMSEAGMVSLRRIARKASERGGMSKTIAACFNGLGNDRLYSTFQHLLAENLSVGDLKAANAFFNSPTGQKLARRNVLRAYSLSGETPPEQEPVLSAIEENAVAEFTATPAGQKLITQKFLTSAESLPVVGARINELYMECGAQRW
jgi:hypothetical protein